MFLEVKKAQVLSHHGVCAVGVFPGKVLVDEYTLDNKSCQLQRSGERGLPKGIYLLLGIF